MANVTESDDAEQRPSKSQRKRDMAALQDVGAELVMLNAGELAQIELPERLLDAIVDAQRIRDFEGRRRQMQYIGKLMREIDAAPIRARLDTLNGAARENTAQQKLIERWRERLLAEDGALTLFAHDFTGCDVQHLRSLIASVKRDRSLNRAPKNYRVLFRAIRDIVGGRGSSPDAE